jgi:hypothetical protein
VLPLWALSALMTIVSMGLFAWNVFVATRSSGAASEAAAAPSAVG